jgi:hypothetical protein
MECAMTTKKTHVRARQRPVLARHKHINAEPQTLKREHDEALARCKLELLDGIFFQQRDAYRLMVRRHCVEVLGVEGERILNSLAELDQVFGPLFATYAKDSDVGKRDVCHGRYISAVASAAKLSAEIQNRKAPNHCAVIKLLGFVWRLNAAWTPQNLGVERVATSGQREEYRVGLCYDPRKNEATGIEAETA